MYEIKVKDSTFTCPKESICLLAMTKAMDMKAPPSSAILQPEGAIEYLESLGMEIKEITDK